MKVTVGQPLFQFLSGREVRWRLGRQFRQSQRKSSIFFTVFNFQVGERQGRGARREMRWRLGQRGRAGQGCSYWQLAFSWQSPGTPSSPVSYLCKHWHAWHGLPGGHLQTQHSSSQRNSSSLTRRRSVSGAGATAATWPTWSWPWWDWSSPVRSPAGTALVLHWYCTGTGPRYSPLWSPVVQPRASLSSWGSHCTRGEVLLLVSVLAFPLVTLPADTSEGTQHRANVKGLFFLLISISVRMLLLREVIL